MLPLCPPLSLPLQSPQDPFHLLSQFLFPPRFPFCPPVFPFPSSPASSSSITLQLTNGSQPSESQSIVLKPQSSFIEPPSEPVSGLLLLSFSFGGARFSTVICTHDNGFNEGEELKLPASWIPHIAISPSANVDGSSVLRGISFLSPLLLASPSPASSSSVSIPSLLPSPTSPLDMTLHEPETHNPSSPSPAAAGFSCFRCGKIFSYSYYRDKHLKYTRCVDNGDRTFKCAICTRSFEKRDRLRIHVLHVHENHRPHSCALCGKAFSQSSSLNKHLRVHSGERPYKCPYCPKSFTASSILRTHIRQHSGEKPFKCAICGKPFASHAAHDSHVRRTHR